MDSDFPAAHSMDTRWFAIDRDGHVATFVSGEAGAVPNRAIAALKEGDGYDILDQMAATLPDGSASLDEDDMVEPALLGLFVYEHGDEYENWISGPYEREEIPSQPLHVDQLPPILRQAALGMRFDDLSFADTPRIQPVEHEDCSSWQDSYVTLDGQEKDLP